MEKWQSIYKNNIRSFEALEKHIPLPNTLSPFPKFPLNIPLRIVDKIERGNFQDPLFLQFVPLSSELVATPGFGPDPVGDTASMKTPKLLHKYAKRALLLVSSACAMHCRYCFRQQFPYEKEVNSYDAEIEYLKNTPSISEVILSGGDPLSKSTPALTALIQKISAIPHIDLIRFHTRFPIGIPERITDDLLSVLTSIRQQVIFVLHVNHASEIDDDIKESIQKLLRAGIPVLTQSVLLRGINNTKNALKELMLTSVTSGMIPYYLHQHDRVQHTAHFEVDPEEGLGLIEALRKELPGYAIPRYVQEQAGHASKTPLHSIESLEPQEV